MKHSQDYAGTKVTVMGLGLFGGGAGVSRFFAERGAEVTVTDLRREKDLALAPLDDLPLRFVLGRHEEADFREADLVVANPAVPPTSRFLEVARSAGVRVTSEVALFLERTRARICAVTGTQGKSSTCNLLTGLLRHSGNAAVLAGNIGGSLLEKVDLFTENDVFVLELSSYQLEALALEGQVARRCSAVAILNILEDHLERHGSFENYAAAKRQLLELVQPGGTVFVPGDSPELALEGPADAQRVEFSATNHRFPLGLDGDVFRWEDESLATVQDLKLPGEFQRANALVALGMARAMGVSTEHLGGALQLCSGLPHRLENCGHYAGSRVWDNAVSTTPDSTVSAMRALDPGFTLLVGGQVKNLSLDELAECAAQRAKLTICFGAGAESFERALTAAGAACLRTDTVPAAVELAFDSMTPGDELLFSPAAASFDAYLNFQVRAADFRIAIRPKRDPRPSGESIQEPLA